MLQRLGFDWRRGSATTEKWVFPQACGKLAKSYVFPCYVLLQRLTRWPVSCKNSGAMLIQRSNVGVLRQARWATPSESGAIFDQLFPLMHICITLV